VPEPRSMRDSRVIWFGIAHRRPSCAVAFEEEDDLVLADEDAVSRSSGLVLNARLPVIRYSIPFNGYSRRVERAEREEARLVTVRGNEQTVRDSSRGIRYRHRLL